VGVKRLAGDDRQATGDGQVLAITLVYSETSTGVINPVFDITEMMKKKYPEVLVFVEAVSAMVGMPIHFDQLGWDIVFASVQKAFTIPPGMAVFAVSKRAMEKSKTVPQRGYYFDFQEFAKSNEKNQTPTTPSIPHIFALHFQCEKLLKEGMENVEAAQGDGRLHWHGPSKARALCRGEVRPEHPDDGQECPQHQHRRLNKALQAKHNTVIGNGYGKLKDLTFRIAHMGDITLRDIKELLGWIDEETK
jgi:aspartate aminotransferase-like enzyme